MALSPSRIVLLVFVILAVVAAVVLGVVYGLKEKPNLGTCPNGWIYKGNSVCQNPTGVGCMPSGTFTGYTDERKKQWATGACALNIWTNTAVLSVGEKAPESGSVPIKPLGTCPNGWIYKGNSVCQNPTGVGCMPSGTFTGYTDERKKQWATGACALNIWTNTAVLSVGEKAPESGSVPIKPPFAAPAAA